MSVAPWVLITVGAAFLQNLRSFLQRRLTGQLSVNGASYVRFAYALPFAACYAAWLGMRDPVGMPGPDFFLYSGVGGIAQVLATVALLASFSGGNFAVGTALSKTETLQAALFGLLLLGEGVSALALVGVVVSFAGVVLLSSRGSLLALSRIERGVAAGLLAGTGFAISAVAYRGAALALPAGDAVTRASVTLLSALTIQTATAGLYLALRERGELQRVWAARRTGVLVGLIGATASVGWFTAMTLTNAALVRAVGQVELLFTFATALWILREKVALAEVVGAVLVLGGILLLL
ncbi:MAG: EamA family transporter [Pseudomonadales bacterium]